MKIVKLPLADLESNIGQIPELPMNPRQWTKTDIDSLAKSLTETPELFEARPLLVVPHEGKYIILGGNLRYEASKHNKETEAPCIVFPEDTPIAKLKEIVIKDNGSFGVWDYDALANEWDDLALSDWGVPAWNTGGKGDVNLDGLFNKEQEQANAAALDPKPTIIEVAVPQDLEDKIEDIRAALIITCEQFEGVKVS